MKLSLRADLADAVRPCAARLGLTVSGLFAALVWNDSLATNSTLKRVEKNPRLSSVSVPCSLRGTHRKLAVKGARVCGLVLNSYLEALLCAHLARGSADLLLRAKR